MSAWSVIIPPPAEKRLRNIPEPDRGRILRAIDSLHDGLTGDIKPLNGRSEWRLRVGGWRVILDVNVSEKIVIVSNVATRGGAYKK